MTEVRKKIPKRIKGDREGLRMSTPVEIAHYRARRLSNESISDLGAGVGIQTYYFSLYFKNVIAVESDENRFKILKRNMKIKKRKNVRILFGNVFDEKIREMIESSDVIFSDPARIKKAMEWTFSELSPNPLDIVSKIKGESYSFDLPVLMKRDIIPESWEREYISLYGEIKRLAVYVGKAKNLELSALILPSGERIVYDPNIERNISYYENVLDYIYEIDPSIKYSGLIPEFQHLYSDVQVIENGKKNLFCTGNLNYADPFFKNTYRVLFRCESRDCLINELISNGAGKVFLRYTSENYYDEKAKIEKNLSGDSKFYIFRFSGVFYGCVRD
ncbi:MAG: class I SAM-dependent methyltransferase [Thermoplasmata archaeon]